MANPSGLPRHMLALAYSSALVRDVTIVNSTRLRNDPTRSESELSCRAFSPPRPRLVFSDTCAAAFAAPSLHGIDRNVELVPGLVDTVGRSAPSLLPAPTRASGGRWELTAGTCEAGADGGVRRLCVEAAALPPWAAAAFEAAGGGGARL